jgi:ABC-type Na+ efflux pump permease subunit
MNKVSLIIRREYITRVRNKRFLLMTFLMPLIFVAFIAGSAYFAATSRDEISVAIIDGPAFLEQNIKSDSGSVLFAFPEGVDSINYKDKKFDAVLYPSYNNGKINAELHSNKEIIDAISKAQQEIAIVAIEKWKEEQKEIMRKNGSSIIEPNTNNS